MYNEVNTSPIKLFFHQKWVRIVLVLDLLAIIAVIAVAIFNTTKTAVITFYVAPVDATITMGGTRYNNGTYQVSPGTYDVTISHPDLNQKTIHLDLPGNSTTNVTTFLSATDDNGTQTFDFYTLKPNYDSFQVLASIAGKDNNQTIDHDTSAELFIAEYQEQYNLYYSSVIPINYQNFTTDAAGEPLLDKSIIIKRASDKLSCQKLLCVQVLTIDANDRDFANSLMEQEGLNLAYLEAHYENF